MMNLFFSRAGAARRRRRGAWAVLLALCGGALAAAPTENLIPNGGFEDGLRGWNPLWTRAAGKGRAVRETRDVHAGGGAVRIEHRGARDWSFSPGRRIPVRAGDFFELDGWVKAEGAGTVTLSVITYDADGRAVDWNYGGRAVGAGKEWRRLRGRFVIPQGVAAIEPRLLGQGPMVARADDLALRRLGNVADLRPAGLPATVALTNRALVVTARLADATFRVRDRRNGREWRQAALRPEWLALDVTRAGGLTLKLLHLPTGRELTAVVRLDAERPEFTVELRGEGPLREAVAFPYPFVTGADTHLVVPLNEGISYPVGDRSIAPRRLIAYGGHGICMAFWGVTDGAAGQMAIIETPDDAAIRIARADGRLFIAPEWDPQKRRFGYARRLRYVFFARGGHVAMAKRYRTYARRIGRFKTLAAKRAGNPDVDRLLGAVNIWCWEGDAVGIVKELQAAGIRRILWSNRQSPENLRALNALGVLTSRYDIYQDAMNPANFPKLRGIHGDWTSDGWPDDLAVDANGDWIRGWRVKGRDGRWYPCGVLCDARALDYAARRIPPELKTHPYRCRFIDTTTAAPWRECWSPRHPMTRGDSHRWKMRLLEYVSKDMGLVCGSETGHDAAVPYVHYFEGMMSLGPYRVPDAGRDMLRVWTEVPERVAKFQLGHRYRLPLWELVYHDCVVAQWYWGDYNNKLPALWDKRDRFNALYGTAPMFMFTRRYWREHRERFARSYRDATTVARRAAYQEMTDHRFLTPDRDVQQTVFANGLTVTVNFGDHPFRMPDGTSLPAGAQRIEPRP